LYDDLFFNDVTLIETPIFLQMYDLIRSASTLLDMENRDRKAPFGRTAPNIALHVKDLISKLESAQYYQILQTYIFNSDLQNLLGSISKITNGAGFSFEKEHRDFYFNKDGSTYYKSINTATGLKAFGMIQLLIQSNAINERALLIIDEPEIHLHPKWQIEYAKLIVELVKNNIPVLLTSHSPEIIQALRFFSEQHNIRDKTAFYLTETEGVMSNIIDVSEDINKIFVKLAEPLHNLVWN